MWENEQLVLLLLSLSNSRLHARPWAIDTTGGMVGMLLPMSLDCRQCGLGVATHTHLLTQCKDVDGKKIYNTHVVAPHPASADPNATDNQCHRQLKGATLLSSGQRQIDYQLFFTQCVPRTFVL